MFPNKYPAKSLLLMYTMASLLNYNNSTAGLLQRGFERILVFKYDLAFSVCLLAVYSMGK